MEPQEDKKTQTALLSQHEKLGHRYNLVFYTCDILPQHVIGLDVIMQKILILETASESIDWTLINLRDVQSCSLKTMYTAPREITLRAGNSVDHVEHIVLVFNFKREQKTVLLPFYEANKSLKNELPMLYEKAGKWVRMIREMIEVADRRA